MIFNDLTCAGSPRVIQSDCTFTETFSVHIPSVKSTFSYSGCSHSLLSRRFGPNNNWNVTLDLYPDLVDCEVNIPEYCRSPSVARTASVIEPWHESPELPVAEDPILESSSVARSYMDAVFTSTNLLNGSVSIKFSSMSGEVLKHDSTPLIAGNSHTVRYTEGGLGEDRTEIIFTIHVVSSTRPEEYPLYNPLQVTDLIARMLDGASLKDVKFVLYRRKPNGSTTKRDIGHVFADRHFLSSKCEYFKSAFHFTTSVKVEQNIDDRDRDEQDDAARMPAFEKSDDYDSDSDFEDNDKERNLDADTEDIRVESIPGATNLIHIPDIAYKTWKAMIFYLYTGNVYFAPLKSNPSHSTELARPSTPRIHGPEPVSSKSMYRLADKIGIPELEHLALRHIKSQLAPENIWEELLSTFTSRYAKVKQLEMEYLINNWCTSRGTRGFQDALEDMCNGKIPHTLPIFSELFSRLEPRR